MYSFFQHASRAAIHRICAQSLKDIQFQALYLITDSPSISICALIVCSSVMGLLSNNFDMDLFIYPLFSSFFRTRITSPSRLTNVAFFLSQIKFLDFIYNSGKSPNKWIRYVTQATSYVARWSWKGKKMSILSMVNCWWLNLVNVSEAFASCYTSCEALASYYTSCEALTSCYSSCAWAQRSAREAFSSKLLVL